MFVAANMEFESPPEVILAWNQTCAGTCTRIRWNRAKELSVRFRQLNFYYNLHDLRLVAVIERSLLGAVIPHVVAGESRGHHERGKKRD